MLPSRKSFGAQAWQLRQGCGGGGERDRKAWGCEGNGVRSTNSVGVC